MQDERLKQCLIDGICEGATAALVVFAVLVILIFIMFTAEPSAANAGMIMSNIWR